MNKIRKQPHLRLLFHYFNNGYTVVSVDFGRGSVKIYFLDRIRGQFGKL